MMRFCQKSSLLTSHWRHYLRRCCAQSPRLLKQAYGQECGWSRQWNHTWLCRHKRSPSTWRSRWLHSAQCARCTQGFPFLWRCPAIRHNPKPLNSKAESFPMWIEQSSSREFPRSHEAAKLWELHFATLARSHYLNWLLEQVHRHSSSFHHTQLQMIACFGTYALGHKARNLRQYPLFAEAAHH